MIYFLQEFMASSCARTCGFCDDNTVTTRYFKKIKTCNEGYYSGIRISLSLSERRMEATEFTRQTHWRF